MFPLDKTEIKNFASSGSHIRGLPICNSDQTKKILIHLTFQSKKGKLHFKNGVKAYDAGTK